MKMFWQYIILVSIVGSCLMSCKKESFTTPVIPEEFVGPETTFENLYDRWDWLYSNSPATIWAPSTGPIDIQIWKDRIRLEERGIETIYLLRNTLEPDSIPYLHCFWPETGEYESSIAIYFLHADTILLHVVNSVAGAENDAVFKRK